MNPSSSRFTRRWKTPAARSFWSIMRVTTGFTSLTLMLLVAAWMLGLLPDHAETALRERRFLTESMAITYAGILQVQKPEQARPMLAEVFRRTPELLSAGIRDDQGKLVAEIGDHEAHWTNREGMQSTDSQMKVPLALGTAALGDLELRFVPVAPDSASGLAHNKVFQFFLFISLSGLAAYGLYVWRIMSTLLMATSMGAVPNRVRASLNTLAEGVLILNREQRVVLANEAFVRMLGRSTREVEGADISSLPWIRPEGQSAAAPYPWEQAAVTGESTTNGILRLQGKNQSPESLSINSTPITGVDGSYRGTMVTFDNLTEIEEKNERLQKLTERLEQSQTEILHQHNEIVEQSKRLEFLATHDPLTGCFNRRAFLEQMKTHWASAIRYGHPLCCIMLDIDHFKSVNDTYGHAVGDEVIKHVAKMLLIGKRDTDIVARFGGEEFMVLLPHVDMGGAMVVAERLRKSIDETACGDIHYTVSMGVAAIDLQPAPSGGQEPDTLLKQADEALYAAKRTGRNRVCRRDRLPEDVPDETRRPTPGTNGASRASGDTGNVTGVTPAEVAKSAHISRSPGPYS